MSRTLDAKEALQKLVDEYGFEPDEAGWFSRGEDIFIGRKGRYLNVRVVFEHGYVQFTTDIAKIRKGCLVLGLTAEVVIEKEVSDAK